MFPEPTIQIASFQPETCRQSIRTCDAPGFASRKFSWVLSLVRTGCMNCSILTGFGGGEGLEVSGLLVWCHVFCLNWYTALCALKSLFPQCQFKLCCCRMSFVNRVESLRVFPIAENEHLICAGNTMLALQFSPASLRCEVRTFALGLRKDTSASLLFKYGYKIGFLLCCNLLVSHCHLPPLRSTTTAAASYSQPLL